MPLTLCTIIFSVSNKHTVWLFFWPLSPSLEMPVYVLSLGILIVGFISGNIFSRIDQSVNWIKQRKSRKKIYELEHELTQLKRRISENQKVTARASEVSPTGNA